MTFLDKRAGLRLAAAALLLASPSAALAKGHGHGHAASASAPNFGMNNGGGVLSNMKVYSCPTGPTLTLSAPPVNGWTAQSSVAAMHLAGVSVLKAPTGGQKLVCGYDGPNGILRDSLSYTQTVTGVSCRAEKNQFTCWPQGSGH